MKLPPLRYLVVCAALAVALSGSPYAAAEETVFKPVVSDDGKKSPLEQPVIVNGDTVEYVTERSEITASGNVKVDYKGTRLSCRKLTVNTVTKDAVAEGDVVIEDANGVTRGESVVYNFNTKKGTVNKGSAASDPYYCVAETISINGDKEIIAKNGYATTCGFDDPHYRVRSKGVRMIPKDKIQTYSDTLYVGDVPCMYLPYYSQSLKDPFMHVRFMPGHSSDWGYFLLSGWRYNLTDSLNGRVYLDYRQKLGWAEGFGANYTSGNFGKGDAKFYYTKERPTEPDEGYPGEFERWFGRWRHKWEIDDSTDYVHEFYKIKDPKRETLGSEFNVLKDYFPREYERDSQPLNYAQAHHYFEYGSLDALVQTRSSKWYNAVERMPEVRYTLPSTQIGDGQIPIYFDDTTQAAYLKSLVASPGSHSLEYDATRFDTYNEISAPFRVAAVDLTPFAAMRNTAYSSGADNQNVDPRTIFYTGTAASMKFYRIFDTAPHYLGMDIDDIRHIVTPTFSYTFNTDPTVRSSRLKQFDAIDAIGENSSVNLELSNRLQTKRQGKSVDFFDFRIGSAYTFYSKAPLTDEITTDRLSDMLNLDLEFLPYSWLTLSSDADYNRRLSYFDNVNYDVSFNLTPSRRFGFGQRYTHSGGNELTGSFEWQLTPKWSFHTYERYQFRKYASERQGFVRQEYGLTRDLHCWLMDINFTTEKESGNSVWIIFRLKAFPEGEINFTHSYNAPKAGSH